MVRPSLLDLVLQYYPHRLHRSRYSTRTATDALYIQSMSSPVSVCTCRVYTSCVRVVCTRRVYVSCVSDVCTRRMYTSCVRVVCTRRVYVSCVHVVCTCRVYVSLYLEYILASKFLVVVGKFPAFVSAAKRIQCIIEYLTYEVFRYTCRGLYETHKFLFTLQLALKIDMDKGYIKFNEFQVWQNQLVVSCWLPVC